MFKQMVSALVVSGVMLSGAAFAADQTAPAANSNTPAQVQTPAATPAVKAPGAKVEATGTESKAPVTKASQHKVHHKAEKTSAVKTEKSTQTAPTKTN